MVICRMPGNLDRTTWWGWRNSVTSTRLLVMSEERDLWWA